MMLNLTVLPPWSRVGGCGNGVEPYAYCCHRVQCWDVVKRLGVKFTLFQSFTCNSICT